VTRHMFQEEFVSGPDVGGPEPGDVVRYVDLRCVLCGAVVHLARQEYQELQVGDLFRQQLEYLMARKEVPPTCEEERVRQVMDS